MTEQARAEYMDARTEALCYLLRNPPDCWDVKPMPYKDIPEYIQQPSLEPKRIEKIVERFNDELKTRGRKEGWRKTTTAEDKQMLQTFHKVRQPLGSLTESTDVWKALKPQLRDKVIGFHFRSRFR